VVEAVEAKKITIYEARHVDEVIELLTGVAAGERGPDGKYPEDSFHGRVERRLAHFADRAKEFAATMRGGEAAQASSTPTGGDGGAS
jgi:hypothetical protein